MALPLRKNRFNGNYGQEIFKVDIFKAEKTGNLRKSTEVDFWRLKSVPQRPAATRQVANRKNYHKSREKQNPGSIDLQCPGESKWRDSNPRPFGPEPNALPNCATPRHGANKGTRTPDLLITNRLLYQLSHIGTTSVRYYIKAILVCPALFSELYEAVMAPRLPHQCDPDTT